MAYRGTAARTLLLVLVSAGVALAGCTASHAPPKGTDAPTVTPKFDAGNGAIHGVVVDDEQVPVKGAQVGLKEQPAMMGSTNPDGEFAISNLAPGTYTLLVASLGYQDFVRVVHVVPDDTVEVSVSLIPAPLAGQVYPVVVGPISGKFFCGFATPALVGPCKGFSLTMSNPLDEQWDSLSGHENNIFNLAKIISGNRTSSSDKLGQAIVEIVWSPSSASAGTLFGSIEKATANRQIDNPVYVAKSGHSPLRLNVTPGVQDPSGTASTVLSDKDAGFLVGVFPDVDPGSPKDPVLGVPIGVSAYTEQKFQFWVTLWYNGPAPDGYTVVPDQ